MEKEQNTFEEVNSFLASLSLGGAAAYKNITVFPVFSDSVKSDGYALLEEAIKSGQFTVSEVSEGGSVPELKVKNSFDKDVVILDGEELVGAKQNRIVNATIIIAMGKEVVIPVSCVERGRWSYRSRNFSAGKSHLYAELRREKSRTVYSSLKTRRNYTADQGQIWHNISEKAARFKVDSSTGAMQDIFGSREKEMGEYEEAFRVREGQVGFIAAINGEIAGCDIFGVGSILPRVHSKLLKSYIIDAIDRAVSHEEQEEPEIEVLKEKAAMFLNGIKKADKEEFKSVGDGTDVRFEHKRTNGFMLVNKSDVVHLAAFAG